MLDHSPNDTNISEVFHHKIYGEQTRKCFKNYKKYEIQFIYIVEFVNSRKGYKINYCSPLIEYMPPSCIVFIDSLG